MKIRPTRAIAAAAAASLLLGLAPAALAAASTRRAHAAPPWGTEANSVGGLVFYNASGQQITSGSIDDTPIAAYVQGSGYPRPSGDTTSDTKATLYAYTPVNGTAPGAWSGEALSGSTVFPNNSAPTALSSSSLPLVTGKNTDLDLSGYIGDFPNGGGAYAGLYELRLRTSAPGNAPSTTYDSAVISVSGSTWSVAYDTLPPTPTTTALQATSASITYGSSDTLTATITPSDVPGSVTFKSGTVVLGTQAVTAGSAKLATSALPGGSDSLTATFTPSDTTAYSPSSSDALSVKVSAATTRTSLKASPASVAKGKKVTLTIKVTPGASGSVSILDGTKRIGGTTITATGAGTFSTSALSVGTHHLKAVFTPKVAADYTSSTSAQVSVVVKK